MRKILSPTINDACTLGCEHSNQKFKFINVVIFPSTFPHLSLVSQYKPLLKYKLHLNWLNLDLLRL